MKKIPLDILMRLKNIGHESKESIVSKLWSSYSLLFSIEQISNFVDIYKKNIKHYAYIINEHKYRIRAFSKKEARKEILLRHNIDKMPKYSFLEIDYTAIKL